MFKLSFIVLLLVIAGCNYNSKSEVELKKKGFFVDGYYNDGTYFTQHYIYNDNGLKVADGYYKIFYKNSLLRSLQFYKNGVLDSVALYYYPNGKLMATEFRKNGIGSGRQIFYDDSGNVKSVVFLKNDSAAFFRINYLPNGKIQTEGKPIRIIIGNKDDFKLNDSLLVVNVIGIMPRIKTEVSIRIKSNTTIKFNQNFTKFFYNNSSNDFYRTVKFRMNEDVDYIAIVKLRDSSSGKLIKRDSIFFPFMVSNGKLGAGSCNPG